MKITHDRYVFSTGFSHYRKLWCIVFFPISFVICVRRVGTNYWFFFFSMHRNACVHVTNEVGKHVPFIPVVLGWKVCNLLLSWCYKGVDSSITSGQVLANSVTRKLNGFLTWLIVGASIFIWNVVSMPLWMILLIILGIFYLNLHVCPLILDVILLAC